jgi:hypothetical protein
VSVNSVNIVNKTNYFDMQDRARDLLAPAGRRHHSMATVRMARQMYGDGTAWSPTQIARYLDRVHGISVHVSTVRLWVIPGANDVQRERNRASYHRRKRLSGPMPTVDPVDLARRLRAEGEPISGIVRVCRVVFGGRWTRRQVLRLLGDES